MSRENLEISVPKCDQCGKRGSYGQMMPWPHSGWVVVHLSDPQRHLDFCSVDHAYYWLRPRGAAGDPE